MYQFCVQGNFCPHFVFALYSLSDGGQIKKKQLIKIWAKSFTTVFGKK